MWSLYIVYHFWILIFSHLVPSSGGIEDNKAERRASAAGDRGGATVSPTLPRARNTATALRWRDKGNACEGPGTKSARAGCRRGLPTCLGGDQFLQVADGVVLTDGESAVLEERKREEGG